jgi:exosome complex component RRP41
LDGKLTADEYRECLNLAISGCMQVYNMQREALMKKYFSTADNGGGEDDEEEGE